MKENYVAAENLSWTFSACATYEHSYVTSLVISQYKYGWDYMQVILCAIIFSFSVLWYKLTAVLAGYIIDKKFYISLTNLLQANWNRRYNREDFEKLTNYRIIMPKCPKCNKEVYFGKSTLFQRSYNVIWMLYWRCFDVLCRLGIHF